MQDYFGAVQGWDHYCVDVALQISEGVMEFESKESHNIRLSDQVVSTYML